MPSWHLCHFEPVHGRPSRSDATAIYHLFSLKAKDSLNIVILFIANGYHPPEHTGRCVLADTDHSEHFSFTEPEVGPAQQVNKFHLMAHLFSHRDGLCPTSLENAHKIYIHPLTQTLSILSQFCFSLCSGLMLRGLLL